MKMYSQIAPMQKTHKNKIQLCPFIVHLMFTLKVITGNTIKPQHSPTVWSLQFLAVNHKPSIEENFYSHTFMCSKCRGHYIRVWLYFKVIVHALSYVCTSTFISRNNTIKFHIVNSDEEPTSVHLVTSKLVSLTEKGESRIKCVFSFSF